ncbi:hypothetical protein ACSX1A_09845 [Pontibacter sp. MBLB2868]|uniref:hypothetical protein n=1 Tax=Pontibacter sp. MBLB2868 TaxID=3451555 RepID=UPI003F75610A
MDESVEHLNDNILRQYPTAVAERVQDWASRVLREGYTLGLEDVALLHKQLVYEAVDEHSFYVQLTAAYQKAHKALLRCKGILQDIRLRLTSEVIEQELIKKYLNVRSEEEAAEFIMSPRDIWNYLQVEKEPVKIRVFLDELIGLLQQGFDSWMSSGDLAPTLQWKESSLKRRQLDALFTELKKLGFIYSQTSPEHFFLLFTSNRAPVKVVWMQRGLPSLIYLSERLLQESLLEAPAQMLQAAKQKEALALDTLVIPWLYERLVSSFAYVDLKGSLKHVTHGMLVDARYRACLYKESSNSLPSWSYKLDDVVKNVLKIK